MTKGFIRFFISVYLLLTPVICIVAFTGRTIDFANLVYGIETIDLVEQINEIKGVAISFESANGIIDLIEKVAQLFLYCIELLIISPLKSIIDIFNLLFV